MIEEVHLDKKHLKSKTKDGTFPSSVLEDLPQITKLERISKIKSKQAQAT